MKKNKLLLFFLPLLLISSGLISYSILGKTPQVTLASTCKPFAVDTTKERGALAECVKHYINVNISRVGAINLERDIIKSVKLVPQINYVCHPYAHAVGKQALIETKDIFKAVKESTSYCAWGYLHGMNVEAGQMYSGQKLFDAMLLGCNEVKKLGGNPYECAHGMGDSFDVKADGNIYEALSWCSKIKDEGIHLNCSQGAVNNYTDWYVVDIQKNHTQQLKASAKALLNGKPYSFCDPITNTIDRSACFNYGSRINNAYRGGLIGWSKYCNDYSGEDNAYCFQGLGREWVFVKTMSNEEAIKNCMTAKTEHGVEVCSEEYLNTITQIQRDRKGTVFNKVCNDQTLLTNPGFRTACKVTASALKSYFEGSFDL